jgi:formimidoylglutamate deiminase
MGLALAYVGCIRIMSAHNKLSMRVLRMTILWAEQALTPEGWAKAVRIEIDASGHIAAVTPNAPREGHALSMALPAPGNLHSHAFQRAMAGLTEFRGPDPKDSFWTWRQLMYRFLDILTPDDIEAITAFVQMEMLEAGYAASAEFHYMHNAPGGAAYDDPVELSARILAAREVSGIGLTQIPVLYAQGGCDGRALEGGQKRFHNDLHSFETLLDANRRLIGTAPDDCALGAAPHSLRAIAKEWLDPLLEMAPDGPFHMHIAEQQAEVVEVLSYLGARPVEWLLSIHDVTERWCLIHATQMTKGETVGLAKSGAVAGLCPITESNLGDGIFDGVRYLAEGGTFGIGSDSNIRISLSEELRTLEYSQRLRDNSRAALATARASTGRILLEGAAKGGAQALGRQAGAISVGNWADILDLDLAHPDLAGLEGDKALDAWIFTRDDRQIKNVWSAGRHLVRDHQHIRRDAITARYANTISHLRGAI